ncbi:MAG TPA: TolC family protein [Gemmatimonadaceae bacterium]|nr:TolC family protein [Gemmatimonadaceae bacterium]
MPTMRYRLGGVLCAAILAAAPPLGAQHPLTLQEAISLAERQGLQAQAARQTLVAARARNRAFGERLLPQISLGGTVPNYSRAIVPVIQPDGSQLFTPLQQTTSQLGVTVSQQLPFTGGSLTVSSSLQRFEMTGAQQVRTWSSAPMTVSLQQDILRPNTMKWDARVQDLTIEISRRQYAEAREAVAQQTTGAFFDLYSAQMAEANAAHNAAVNDTLYTLNKGRFQVGKIGENDLLQSELALLRARTSLDGAKLDLDRALSAFRLAINVPADTAVTIAVTSDVPKVELDTTLAVTEALRNSSAIAGLALQDVEARRAVTQAQLATGIGASMQASFGFNASGSGPSSVYSNLLQAQQFSLGIQVPLVQWGAHSADVQAARADQDRVAATSRAMREQTVQNARFAALSVAQAARNLMVSAKADTVASKRFEVAYERYVIGKIDIDNLYIAQNDKDQALQQYVQALRGYWTAYYQLRQLTLYDFAAGRPIRP